MSNLMQDVKYAARMLAKSPGFSAIAVLTLALGIGANTAIFTLVNEALLRPRPGIGRAEQLVDIGRTQDGSGFDNMSYPNYADYRDRATSFSGMLGYSLEPRAVSLGATGSAERIFGSLVSGNYFDVLEVKPHLGRFFAAEEDRAPGAHPVMVLSFHFWQRHFRGDRAAAGRELRINGQPFTVVGVAPEGFRGTSPLAPDAWFPMMMSGTIIPGSTLLDSRRSVWMVAIGRLRPGVPMAQAQAEMSAIAKRLEEEFPEANRGKGIKLTASSLFPGDLRQIIAAFLGLLQAIVGLVLLIACVNVAGMLLVRATTRRREIAVRLAIGAGRGQVVRQLLTEGVLLFLLGGTAGLLFAVWMRDLLLGLLPALPVPVALDLPLDWRVMLFALLMSLATGLLASLAPAWQASRAELVQALKDEGPSGGSRKLRLRSALVLAQVAVSLVLLVCAGLFLRALERAGTIDPGFDVHNLRVLELDLSLAGYREADGLAFAESLLERVRALPGVEGAAFSWAVPLDGGGRALGGVAADGVETPEGGEGADWNVVTPGYFAALKAPLVRGRDFTAADRAGSAGVAIINETLAERFWPGRDPVGQTIRTPEDDGRPDTVRTVVGVARNQKYRSLGDGPRNFVYVALRQNYMARVSLMLRSPRGAAAVQDVRAALRQMNPYLPVVSVQTMEETAALSMFPQRVAGGVAASLGAIGLLLTGIGIYGVTAFSVGQRTREIGIRMALGAQRAAVLRMLLRQGMQLAALGAALGLAAALALSHLLESLLFGVSAQDPLTFSGVTGVLLAVALAATLVPARRAARVDPMVALRHE